MELYFDVKDYFEKHAEESGENGTIFQFFFRKYILLRL